MTETRKHRVEKRTAKRYRRLMEPLRDALFSQWHVSVARTTLWEGQKEEKGEVRWAQAEGDGRPKVGSASQQHDRVVREG